MPLSALLLLFVAALLHTSWNLLVKRARERLVFTWLAMAAGSICFAPLLALGPALPRAVWPYVLASALAQAAYYLALTRAYRLGDFSLVYPLARGAAPAFLALWAILLLGERPQPLGLGGLLLLLAGLLIVGSARRATSSATAASPGHGSSPSAVIAALAVALCISIYSVIDAAAVRVAPPATYTVAEIGASAVMAAPLVLARHGPGAVAAEWRANWRQVILVGVLTLLTYALVLQAYQLARVSYAGAVREISVVFAALAGWRWLGEGFGVRRAAGAAVIFAGILVIAVAG